MAGSGNNRTLVAAIRADVSAALASARQLADGFVRVGSAVRATDEQIKEAGKLLGTLRIKSESWTKAQVEGIEKQIAALAKLRQAGAVTGNEYDRFTAAARAKIVRLGEALGQDMRTAAQKAGDGLASLGVKSEASQRQAQAAIKQTIKDLKALKAAGEITGKDLALAMRAANQALGKDVRTLSEKIRDALGAVGVRRTIDVNKDIAAQKKLIATYEEWGRKGKLAADDVARAVEAARKKIEAFNKELGKDTRTGSQRAQAITSKYGVDTKAETEKKIALINKEIEALNRLKAANQIDPRSFNAAIASMNKKIQELNKTLGNDTRSAADKAADVMKKFGVAGEAAVRKTVSEIRQQIIEMNKARKAGEITERDFVASYRKMRAEIHALNQSIGKESKSAAQKASDAWTAFGMKRKRQIEEEIAGVRKTAQEALKAANLSAGERYRIEQTLAKKVKALHKELANSTATAMQQRMQAAAGAANSASQKLLSGAMGLAPVSLAAGAIDKSMMDRTIDFDKAWRATESRLMSESAESMAALRKEVLTLGAETAFTAGQVAYGAEAMAGAGTSADTMTSGGLEASVYLAGALNMDLVAASKMLSAVALQFGYSGDQLMKAADTIVGLKNSSLFSTDDLPFMFSMGGGVASLLGTFKLEEYAAAQAATSFLPGSGSDGGTSMKTLMQNFVTDEKATAREKYGLDFYRRSPEQEAATKASKAGITEAERLLALAQKREMNARASSHATDEDRERASQVVAQREAELERARLDGEKKIGEARAAAHARGFKTEMLSMREVFGIFEKMRKEMSDDEYAAMAASVGGQDSMRVLLGMGSIGVAGYDASLAKVQAGDAQDSSEQRLAGLHGDMERFKSAWDNMLISIMESGLDDVLSYILESFTSLFQVISELPTWAKNVIAFFMVFGGVLAPLVLLAGGAAKVFSIISLILGALGPAAAGAAAGAGLLAKILGGLSTVLKAPIKALWWLLKNILTLGGPAGRAAIMALIGWIRGIALAALGIPAIAGLLFVGMAAAMVYWRKEIGDFIKWMGAQLGDAMGLDESTKQRWGEAWDRTILGKLTGRDEETAPGEAAPGAPVQQFAKGVIGLRGPGTGTSDSIPAMLSNGESVITAASTAFWGSDFMRAIQSRDRSAVMRPVPVMASGARGARSGEGLQPVHLHFEGSGSYPLLAQPSVAAAMSSDQNLKRLLRKTNPSKGFR